MSFFTYSQNNSGGNFHYDEVLGIGEYVIVEADTNEEANLKAEIIGLYFDGYGDCECCGSRWSDLWISGDDEPTVGGRHPSEVKSFFGDGPAGFIHYKSGAVISFDDIQR